MTRKKILAAPAARTAQSTVDGPAPTQQSPQQIHPQYCHCWRCIEAATADDDRVIRFPFGVVVAICLLAWLAIGVAFHLICAALGAHS